MLVLSIFLLLSLSVMSFTILFIMIGEHYSKKYPDSKFKRWWNSHVVTEINDNI